MTKESIALYYREGSSDKVYQAALVEVSGGFLVNFAYGRRGSTLNPTSATGRGFQCFLGVE
jgi:bifunctional non-homologous end joining protein LigD